MSANIVQAHYEQLEQIAARFATAAETQQALLQRVNQRVDMLRQGGWQGKGVAAFLREMDGEVNPSLQRLTDVLREANTTTRDLSALLRQAEQEASAPFMNLVHAYGPNGSNAWQGFVDVGKSIFDAADKLYDLRGLVAAPFLLFFLKPGSGYTGQLILKAPDWFRNLGIGSKWLREMGGLSGSLTHIKVANLPSHIGRMGRTIGFIGAIIAIGKGTFAVADEWTARADEYAGYSGSRRISAQAVDAVLAVTPVTGEVLGGIGGTIGGAKLGALAGAGIGSAIPVVGTVVGAGAGAIIGGALGGFAGDWLGGHLGGAVADQVRSSGLRESAIDIIDEKIAAPASNVVTSTWQQISDASVKPALARVSFGWQ